MYSRVRLYSEMPPLEISIQDRFKASRGPIAYTIPLYNSKSARHFAENKKYDEIYLQICENYIKRAFWIAYELSAHAGLETLSDFYITADTEMREKLEPYRQLCRFPESHIVEVPDVHSVWIDYMPKIVMLTRLAAQTDYRYYVHLDTSMCFPVECQFCLSFKEHWEKAPETFAFYKPWVSVSNFFEHFRAENLLSVYVHRHYRDLFISKIPQFFGEDSYDYYLRRVLAHPVRCSGHLYGIPRSHILSENWREFLDFIAETQCVTLDEMFLALYWHKYLSPDKRLYRHINSLSEMMHLGIDDVQDPPRFEPGVPYWIYRAFKPTAEFHDFFVQYYQNINRNQQ